MIPLAHFFQIRPWEIELLTIDEFLALCDACDALMTPKP